MDHIELRVPSNVLISLNEAVSLLGVPASELLEVVGLDSSSVAARHPEHGFFASDSIESWRDLLGLCDA